MYRRISDFLEDWARESAMTRKVFGNLTDAALSQTVTPDRRSAGFLAWHITQCIGMGAEGGLTTVQYPGEHEPIPDSAAEIATRYERSAGSLAEAVRSEWSDDSLGEEVPMYGEVWPRGKVLSVLIRHEAHHRGQLTVLMRQAGLPVPGVYGPSREEWAEYGMEPMP